MTTRTEPIPRRRAGRVLLGAAAVAGALLLGVLAGPGGTAVDEAVARTLERWCARPACQTASDALATEGGWPFVVYASVVLPLVVAGGLLPAARGEQGRRARALAGRLLVLLVVMAVAQVVLSHVYGRVGPRATSSDPSTAYPSGAALLVAFAWLGAGLVVALARPGWRGVWWPLAAGVLLLHAVVRVAASKHWATDIAGSYLLVAGVLALATSRSRPPPPEGEAPPGG
jgi:membrane-associated phospholipid phosphatase